MDPARSPKKGPMDGEKNGGPSGQGGQKIGKLPEKNNGPEKSCKGGGGGMKEKKKRSENPKGVQNSKRESPMKAKRNEGTLVIRRSGTGKRLEKKEEGDLQGPE